MRRTLVLILGFGMLLPAVPRASAQVGGQPYVGEILLVTFNFAPKGWAECAGQLMSISQNTALFSLLGTTYGGDGKTNFALPDLRGRSAIGAGQGPGLALYDLGQTGGEETVTLLVSQMPAHTHTVIGSNNVATLAAPGGNLWAAQSLLNMYGTSSDSPMAPGAIGMTGGGLPHDNLSPYLTLNYIIALQGIFPPRS